MADKLLLGETVAEQVEKINALVEEINAGGGSSQGGEQVPFVIGTHTNYNGTWTGVASELTELKDGQSIRYWLPYYATTSATLTLTLADGTTDPLNCYYYGANRLNSQFKNGSVILLTYRENVSIPGSALKHTGWWASGVDNRDMVTQNNVTTNSSYPLLFSGSTTTGSVIGSVSKNGNFTANPSTGELSAKSFVENGKSLKETYAPKTGATTASAGLMSASDKSKLDGITASADSVSFTQTLTSGEKIGDITINGTSTPIYAPTAHTVPETKLYRHTVKLFHETDAYNSNAVAIVITKSSDRFKNLTEFNGFLYDNGYLQNSDADEAIVTGDGCPAKGISLINSSGECYLVMSVAYKSEHGGSYINAVKYGTGNNTITTLGLWLTDVEDTVHEIL